MKSVYKYNICNEPDSVVFSRQCRALENHIPNITETECYNDIDGSQTTVYHTAESKTISVHNSNYIGAVYIESDVQLEQYFKSVEAR